MSLASWTSTCVEDVESAVSLRCLTMTWSRRGTRAAHPKRCYDFQCQELVATFSGHDDAFVLGALEEAEPVRSDG